MGTTGSEILHQLRYISGGGMFSNTGPFEQNFAGMIYCHEKRSSIYSDSTSSIMDTNDIFLYRHYTNLSIGIAKHSTLYISLIPFKLSLDQSKIINLYIKRERERKRKHEPTFTIYGINQMSLKGNTLKWFGNSFSKTNNNNACTKYHALT